MEEIEDEDIKIEDQSNLTFHDKDSNQEEEQLYYHYGDGENSNTDPLLGIGSGNGGNITVEEFQFSSYQEEEEGIESEYSSRSGGDGRAEDVAFVYEGRNSFLNPVFLTIPAETAQKQASEFLDEVEESSFSLLESIQNHQENTFPTNEFAVPTRSQGSEIARKISDIQPRNRRTDLSTLVCMPCNLVFTTQFEVDEHRMREHLYLYGCEICNAHYTNKQVRKKHESSHRVNGSYICPFCSVPIKRKNRLVTHVSKAHLSRPRMFGCSSMECELMFGNIKELLEHKVTNEHFQSSSDSNSNPTPTSATTTIFNPSFKCCEQTFTDYELFKAHFRDFHENVNVNLGEPCKDRVETNKIGRTTTTTTNNNNKISPPEDEEAAENLSVLTQYPKCATCNLTFVTLVGLQNHEKKRHKTKFICPLCNLVFENNQLLQKHNKEKHTTSNTTAQLQEKCPDCKNNINSENRNKKDACWLCFQRRQKSSEISPRSILQKQFPAFVSEKQQVLSEPMRIIDTQRGNSANTSNPMTSTSIGTSNRQFISNETENPELNSLFLNELMPSVSENRLGEPINRSNVSFSGRDGSFVSERTKITHEIICDLKSETEIFQVWFAQTPNPTDYQVQEYTNLLNRGNSRQTFPLTPENLRNWFENARKRSDRVSTLTLGPRLTKDLGKESTDRLHQYLNDSTSASDSDFQIIMGEIVNSSQSCPETPSMNVYHQANYNQLPTDTRTNRDTANNIQITSDRLIINSGAASTLPDSVLTSISSGCVTPFALTGEYNCSLLNNNNNIQLQSGPTLSSNVGQRQYNRSRRMDHPIISPNSQQVIQTSNFSGSSNHILIPNSNSRPSVPYSNLNIQYRSSQPSTIIRCPASIIHPTSTNYPTATIIHNPRRLILPAEAIRPWTSDFVPNQLAQVRGRFSSTSTAPPVNISSIQTRQMSIRSPIRQILFGHNPVMHCSQDLNDQYPSSVFVPSVVRQAEIGGNQAVQIHQHVQSQPAESSERRLEEELLHPVEEVPILMIWFNNNSKPTDDVILKHTSDLNGMPYRTNRPRLKPNVVKTWFKCVRGNLRRGEDIIVPSQRPHSTRANQQQQLPESSLEQLPAIPVVTLAECMSNQFISTPYNLNNNSFSTNRKQSQNPSLASIDRVVDDDQCSRVSSSLSPTSAPTSKLDKHFELPKLLEWFKKTPNPSAAEIGTYTDALNNANFRKNGPSLLPRIAIFKFFQRLNKTPESTLQILPTSLANIVSPASLNQQNSVKDITTINLDDEDELRVVHPSIVQPHELKPLNNHQPEGHLLKPPLSNAVKEASTHRLILNLLTGKPSQSALRSIMGLFMKFPHIITAYGNLYKNFLTRLKGQDQVMTQEGKLDSSDHQIGFSTTESDIIPGASEMPHKTTGLNSSSIFDPLSEIPLMAFWFSLNPNPDQNLILKCTRKLNNMPFRKNPNNPQLSTNLVEFWFKNKSGRPNSTVMRKSSTSEVESAEKPIMEIDLCSNDNEIDVQGSPEKNVIEVNQSGIVTSRTELELLLKRAIESAKRKRHQESQDSDPRKATVNPLVLKPDMAEDVIKTESLNSKAPSLKRSRIFKKVVPKPKRKSKYVQCRYRRKSKAARKRNRRLKYKCLKPDCGCRFLSIILLKIHRYRAHVKIRVVRCTFCNKSFVTKNELNKHIPYHKDEFNLLCSECGMTFSKWDSLHVHRLVHFSEQPHKCEYCGKGFNEMRDLTKHMSTDKEDGPIICEFCGQLFIGSCLRYHLSTVHNQPRPYKIRNRKLPHSNNRV